MGLLGTILQDFAGQEQGGNPLQSGMPQASGAGPSGLGGGMGSAVLPALISMMTNSGGGMLAQGNASPLSGLLGRFEQAGLGHLAQSWVGSGTNQAISPEQVHSALGDDQVQSMSQQTGMAPNDVVSEVARILPSLIDRLTPNGAMPSAQDMHIPAAA